MPIDRTDLINRLKALRQHWHDEEMPLEAGQVCAIVDVLAVVGLTEGEIQNVLGFDYIAVIELPAFEAK